MGLYEISPFCILRDLFLIDNVQRWLNNTKSLLPVPIICCVIVAGPTATKTHLAVSKAGYISQFSCVNRLSPTRNIFNGKC